MQIPQYNQKLYSLSQQFLIVDYNSAFGQRGLNPKNIMQVCKTFKTIFLIEHDKIMLQKSPLLPNEKEIIYTMMSNKHHKIIVFKFINHICSALHCILCKQGNCSGYSEYVSQIILKKLLSFPKTNSVFLAILLLLF